jgi:asparagine synthetase B (glutamine-hydrolysing)
MLLISNSPIKSSQSFGDFYVALEPDSGWVFMNSKLVFKGAFWTKRTQKKLEPLADAALSNASTALASVDSIFAVVGIDEDNNTISFANDRYGLKTLYIYLSSERDDFALSDSFSALQHHIPLELLEPDTQGIAEFLLFNYPLFGRTFLKDVSRAPMATIGTFRDDHLVLKRYWRVEAIRPQAMSVDLALRRLDCLLSEATELILREDPAISFGLGLSGGMDSRVVAAFCVEQRRSPHCFVFGQPGADSYRVSTAIAKELGLNLTKLMIDSSFFLKAGNDVVVPNPMINLITSWPLASCGSLPDFNKLLTGFLGGELLGGHIKLEDLTIETDHVTRTAKRIVAEYGENGTLGDIQGMMRTAVCAPVLSSVLRYVKQHRHLEPWRIIEIFDFSNRQLAFIKSNPIFHLAGRESVSPFMYPPFVDFSNSLDVSKKLDMALYRRYIISRFPRLAGIRAERESATILTNPTEAKLRHIVAGIERVVGTSFFSGKPHKEFLTRMGQSHQFAEFVLNRLEQKNDKFKEVIDTSSAFPLLKKLQRENRLAPVISGKRSFRKILLLFALLTVKFWFDSLFK